MFNVNIWECDMHSYSLLVFVTLKNISDKTCTEEIYFQTKTGFLSVFIDSFRPVLDADLKGIQ